MSVAQKANGLLNDTMHRSLTGCGEAGISQYGGREDVLCEMEALENDPGYEAAIKLQEVIKLAKKWNNSQTEYNRTQFIVAFNALNDRDQDKAVAKGSELSKILIGWCAATRLELDTFKE